MNFNYNLLIEILTGIFCGAIFGLERQFRGKPVGMRTSILIVLGTMTYVYVAKDLSTSATDATRIIGQVVTGIGFLGAGVILSKEGLVFGMTSASVVWILAAIGCAIAYNKIRYAICITLLCVLLLIIIRWLEHRYPILRRGVHSDPDHLA